MLLRSAPEFAKVASALSGNPKFSTKFLANIISGGTFNADGLGPES